MMATPIRRRHGGIAAGLGAMALALTATVGVAAAGVWQSTTTMPKYRFAMAATTGIDGKAYLLGGKSVGNLPNVTMVYDPATRRWSQLPPVGGAHLAAATGIQGKIYAIGGGVYSAEDIWYPTAAVMALSPARGTWSAVAPLTVARGALAAVRGPDGLIYALGGMVASTQTGIGVGTTAVEVYDPRTNRWSPGVPMPTERDHFAAVAAPDGRIYVIGGWRSTEREVAPGDYEYRQTVLASVDAYSPQAHTWTAVRPMPVAGEIKGAAMGADGRLYVVGTDGVYGKPFTVAYNLQTRRWSTLPAPPWNGLYASLQGPVVSVGSNHTLLDVVGTTRGYQTSPVYTLRT